MTTTTDITADWDQRLLRKITFHSKESLLAGPEGGYCEVYSDRWWVIHPTRGAIFFSLRPSRHPASWGSPACNMREDITAHVRNTLYPGADIEFIHRAYVPIDLNDYNH